MLQTENRGGTLTRSGNEGLIKDWHNQTADGALEYSN
jgi:hypothetical protein